MLSRPIAVGNKRMGRQRLIDDMNRIEDVLEETVNTPEHKYVYAIALAVWDILKWILIGK